MVQSRGVGSPLDVSDLQGVSVSAGRLHVETLHPQRNARDGHDWSVPLPASAL